MYGLLCKRLELVLPYWSRALVHSTTHLGFLQFDDTSSIHIMRTFSSSFNKRSSSEPKDDTNKLSFAVSYLIDYCGLSLENAVVTSQKVNLQTPDKADSVLALFRNHGFSKTYISKLVRQRPTLLFADPEKTLRPKLQFFYSVGISSADLPIILSKNPSLLVYSLEKHTIPTYDYLKSVVPEEQLVVAFRRFPRLFSYDVEKRIAHKVASLRELGVPESHISKFITFFAPRNNEKFTEIVEKVIKMGFCPSKATFILAIRVFFELSKSTWEHKVEVFRRWGWSEDEFSIAFKMHPRCMQLSEKKIASTMEYLVNKMGWQPTAIARYPVVLNFNLEKRIIPRCSVMKALMLKDLIKKDLSLTFMYLSEKHFQEKFVTKYQEEFPQLLNVYEGKMALLDLGFGLAE